MSNETAKRPKPIAPDNWTGTPAEQAMPHRQDYRNPLAAILDRHPWVSAALAGIFLVTAVPVALSEWSKGRVFAAIGSLVFGAICAVVVGQHVTERRRSRLQARRDAFQIARVDDAVVRSAQSSKHRE
jgi:hypothetical protein